jgi:hypothetical protein
MANAAGGSRANVSELTDSSGAVVRMTAAGRIFGSQSVNA